MALLTGLASAPPGAWRGDLLMVAAALCMALYSIWSKPFIRRSGPIPFTASSMGAGAACLVVISWMRGRFAPVADFGAAQWFAVAYLGAFGGALTFYLWTFALERTTPTRVAISVAVIRSRLRWSARRCSTSRFAGASSAESLQCLSASGSRPPSAEPHDWPLKPSKGRSTMFERRLDGASARALRRRAKSTASAARGRAAPDEIDGTPLLRSQISFSPLSSTMAIANGATKRMRKNAALISPRLASSPLLERARSVF